MVKGQTKHNLNDNAIIAFVYQVSKALFSFSVRSLASPYPYMRWKSMENWIASYVLLKFAWINGRDSNEGNKNFLIILITIKLQFHKNISTCIIDI